LSENNHTLEKLIDISLFQDLQERLNRQFDFPSAIIDNDGKVHTAVAWQDICTNFHRKHPECNKECVKSDQYILDHIDEANPLVTYTCPHGLIDCAAPIIIGDRHIGNFFTGQFFLKRPDKKFFRKQARKYGFDEQAYIEALEKVPVWTKRQFDGHMEFVKGFIEVIQSYGERRLREYESMDALKDYRERLKFYLDQSPMAIVEWDSDERFTKWTGGAEKIFGWKEDEVLGKTAWDIQLIYEEDEKKARNTSDKLVSGEDQTVIHSARNLDKEGQVHFIEWISTSLKDREGKVRSVLSAGFDISQRRQAEELITEQNRQMAVLNQYFLQLSELSASDDVSTLVTGKLKELTGAYAVSFSLFDEEQRTMVLKHLETDSDFLETVTKLLGRKIQKMQFEVSDAIYDEMTSKRIGIRSSLHEASLGAFPKATSKKIQQLAGVDRFIGIAYSVDGKLYGNSLIALKKEATQPGEEILETFIHSTSTFLKRRKAEVELEKARNSLRGLHERMVNLTERYNAHYADTIHYRLGQMVTGLIMELAWMRKNASSGKSMEFKLMQVEENLKIMSDDINTITSMMRPAMLEEVGLTAAIDWFCKEFEKSNDIQCNLSLDEPPVRDDAINLLFFRILQEALSNVGMHAQAGSVDVTLAHTDSEMIMTVSDDGVGIKPAKIHSERSLGLVGMRERLHPFGGRLEIQRGKRQGTVLTVTVPYKHNIRP